MSKPTNQNYVPEDMFINLIKSRIFEIKHQMKTAKPSEKHALQTALANNCAWLISMGHNLDASAMGEV